MSPLPPSVAGKPHLRSYYRLIEQAVGRSVETRRLSTASMLERLEKLVTDLPERVEKSDIAVLTGMAEVATLCDLIARTRLAADRPVPDWIEMIEKRRVSIPAAEMAEGIRVLYQQNVKYFGHVLERPLRSRQSLRWENSVPALEAHTCSHGGCTS